MRLACGLRNDSPADGAWNMALDEALLNLAAEQGVATLRLYQWTPATLSLGYFQSESDRASHEQSTGCPVVRRHSGGGAIVHDRELTYSLAVPPVLVYSRDPYALYFAAHETLRDTLQQDFSPPAGVAVELCQPPPSRPRSEDPFLCFLRRSVGDLLIRSAAAGLPETVDQCHKVGGSSQRKRQGAILQHGSILLQASPRAPELPGIEELIGQEITAGGLAEAWLPRLSSRLSLELHTSECPQTKLEEEAQGILASKFGSDAWTYRR
ncbi:Octanoyltransferase LipM [Posidoniimonas polymericola]|uniref:Octanoyltransferase LipM n=1 Tax=Posidoniimonas polymericola TaxID=2528002 RepID=A0A5C5YMD9_9BACT|nr:hypothetical protein [Posidoniimonas polymericola]TWT76084.1 Octanoyltransferase LipM [Posidoniimonas polymericola]